jgi:hypothetical protein
MGAELINLSALEDLLASNNRHLLDAIYALVDATAQAGRADRPQDDDDDGSGQNVTASKSKRKPGNGPASGNEDDRQAEGLTSEADLNQRIATLAQERGALVLGRKSTDPLGMLPPDEPVKQRTTVVGGMIIPGEVADSERDISALTAERKRAGGLVIPDDRNEKTTRAELIALMSADVREMLTTNTITRDKRTLISGLALPQDDL